MMTKSEFRNYLSWLGLSQTEAAQLLSVNARTVRRWAEYPVEIPGPAEQALRAWRQLDRLGLCWRPDAISLAEKDPDSLADAIAIHRRHTIELDALIQRVTARGGPDAPWIVDLQNRRATLGAMQISFYPLRDGTFSPGWYKRRDREPDRERDRLLIEDWLVLIAEEIAKAGPHWADRKPRAFGMKLKIMAQSPTYNLTLETLRVPAFDEGRPITCSIQRAALESIAGVENLSPSEMVQVFEEHCDRIVEAFQRKYAIMGPDREWRVVLTPEDSI